MVILETWKMSKTGVGFCLVYLVLTIICIIAGRNAKGDHKGRFVLLQAPIAFQSALADKLGVAKYLSRLSWFTAYILFLPPTLAVIYFAGFITEYVLSSNYGLVSVVALNLVASIIILREKLAARPANLFLLAVVWCLPIIGLPWIFFAVFRRLFKHKVGRGN
jgi:hypothetical protein